MMNVTTWLAVRIRFLPDYPFNWFDTSPQKSHQSLTVEVYLSSASESQQLEERATHYMMGFLHMRSRSSTICSSHGALASPSEVRSDPHEKRLLFKDEKYKCEILSQLIRDANLSEDPQVLTKLTLNS